MRKEFQRHRWRFVITGMLVIILALVGSMIFSITTSGAISATGNVTGSAIGVESMGLPIVIQVPILSGVKMGLLYQIAASIGKIVGISIGFGVVPAFVLSLSASAQFDRRYSAMNVMASAFAGLSIRQARRAFVKLSLILSNVEIFIALRVSETFSLPRVNAHRIQRVDSKRAYAGGSQAAVSLS